MLRDSGASVHHSQHAGHLQRLRRRLPPYQSLSNNRIQLSYPPTLRITSLSARHRKFNFYELAVGQFFSHAQLTKTKHPCNFACRLYILRSGITASTSYAANKTSGITIRVPLPLESHYITRGPFPALVIGCHGTLTKLGSKRMCTSSPHC